MKRALAILVVVLPLVSCKRNSEIQPSKPMTIVYDRWWSSDYAANAGEMSCKLQATKMCEDDARADETEFFGKFSAAFQSDPACAGLRLLVYDGHSSQTIEQQYNQSGVAA